MSFVGQVAHVFKKDLRRFWPYVLGLLAVVVLHMVDALPWIDQISPYQLRLPAESSIVTLGFIVLTAAVVLDDAASGDLAFWPTRPLRPSAVVAAKLLFLGIFVLVIPSLAHVHWIQARTLPGDSLGLLGDTLLAHGATILAVAGIAAIARSMKGFLAALLCAWIAYTALVGVVTVEPEIVDPGAFMTRRYLTLWLVQSVGVAALLHQYATRRTLRTVLGASTLLATGVFVLSRTSIDFTERELNPAYIYGEQTGVDQPAAWLRNMQLRRGERRVATEDEAWASADILLRTEDEVLFRLVHSTSEVRNEGETLSFDYDPEQYDHGMTYDPRGLGRLEGLELLGGSAAGHRPDSNISTMIARAPVDDFSSRFVGGEVVDLHLELEAMKGTVLATLPLSIGSTAEVGRAIYEILSVHRSPGSIEVEVSRRNPGRLLDRTQWQPWAGPTILIANPTRREYFGLGRGNSSRPGQMPLLPGARLEDRTEVHQFPLAMFAGRMDDPPDDSWFEDATLIIAGMEIVGETTVDLRRTIERWPASGGWQEIDGNPPRRPVAGQEGR